MCNFLWHWLNVLTQIYFNLFKNVALYEFYNFPARSFPTRLIFMASVVRQHKRHVINTVTVLVIFERNYFCRSYKYSFIVSVESPRRRFGKVANKTFCSLLAPPTINNSFFLHFQIKLIISSHSYRTEWLASVLSSTFFSPPENKIRLQVADLF